MLPQLNKKRTEVHKNSHDKLPVQPRDNYREYQLEKEQQKDSGNQKSASAKKVRTGGGFNKYTPEEQASGKYEPNFTKNFNSNYGNTDKLAKFQKMKFSGSNLAAQIKMIERKIKNCQKKLEQDKRRQKLKAEQATRDKQEPFYDFQNVVQRQLQMQGYYQIRQDNNDKNFDYLTNPGGKPKQQPEQLQKQPIIAVPQKAYNIEEGIQKLQRHYQNNLKRKFERRQAFPHQACKRKTPKLYISHKTNTLNKYGKVSNDAEHMFRVYTKQTTPQQIYPTIPNFAVVKDNLSRNIVAYLGDYKPFLDKTKQKQEAADKNSDELQNQDDGYVDNEGNKRSNKNTGKYANQLANSKGDGEGYIGGEQFGVAV